MSRPWASVFVLLALLAAVAAPPADAGPLDKWRKKAEDAATKAVGDKVEEEVTEAVECALDDAECQEKAKQEGRDVVLVDAEGKPVTDPPGEGVWRNYDFTPGRDVWRHIALDDERIGRFPAGQLEFVKGNMQIVELDGKRVLESSSNGIFRILLDEVLPEGFTLEFNLRIGAPNMMTRVYFSPLETAHSRYEYHYLSLYQRSGVDFQGNAVSNIDGQSVLSQQLTPIRLQVDGQYTILYVGTERAANIPNASFPRGKVIEFHVGGNKNLRSYLSDFTIAVGLDRLYDSLMATGSFTTRGILFDIDSARLRPESTPTLIEIEDTLKKHAELKVRIEGHTDNTGADDHNLELSEKRARAVVSYLADHGIDASRLAPAGLGESSPVADNATPAGRQQNRRVVIALQDAG